MSKKAQLDEAYEDWHKILNAIKNKILPEDEYHKEVQPGWQEYQEKIKQIEEN